MSFETPVVVPGASSLHATSAAEGVHSLLRMSITVSAFGPYLPTAFDNSYTDVLPSGNLKFDLREVHEVLEPPTYLEIGIRHGDSLALARCPSIGVDPAYDLRVDPPPGATLYRFRALSLSEAAYPYLAGGSNVVRVRKR